MVHESYKSFPHVESVICGSRVCASVILLLNAEMKSYMARPTALLDLTLSDLEKSVKVT